MVDFLKSPECPKCRTQTRLRIVRDLGNVGLVIANLVGLVLALVLWSGGPEIPLKRKCLDCGTVFTPVEKFPRPKGRCRSCGYNLTGNVSGVCPECGTSTGALT